MHFGRDSAPYEKNNAPPPKKKNIPPMKKNLDMPLNLIILIAENKVKNKNTTIVIFFAMLCMYIFMTTLILCQKKV